MDWSQDLLWSKAKIYMDRAIEEQREGPLFPFWCSLALEFLARSAVVTVSPTLLAEPDKDHANLLYALGRSSLKRGPKSIGTSLVFLLCKQLVPNFGQDELVLCESMAHRRNEELHSGGLPFDSLPGDWLFRFYATAEILLVFQGRNLIDFLGKKEAAAAKKMIDSSKQQVVEKVKKSISAHKTTFEELLEKEKQTLLTKSNVLAQKMTSNGGHRVNCPACSAKSWVTGEEVSRQEPKLEGDEIVERSSMLPTMFTCIACGLKLLGHAELQVAGIGGQFTRSLRHDPLYYYGYGEILKPREEYNNE